MLNLFAQKRKRKTQRKEKGKAGERAEDRVGWVPMGLSWVWTALDGFGLICMGLNVGQPRKAEGEYGRFWLKPRPFYTVRMPTDGATLLRYSGACRWCTFFSIHPFSGGVHILEEPSRPGPISPG